MLFRWYSSCTCAVHRLDLHGLGFHIKPCAPNLTTSVHMHHAGLEDWTPKLLLPYPPNKHTHIETRYTHTYTYVQTHTYTHILSYMQIHINKTTHKHTHDCFRQTPVLMARWNSYTQHSPTPSCQNHCSFWTSCKRTAALQCTSTHMHTHTHTCNPSCQTHCSFWTSCTWTAACQPKAYWTPGWLRTWQHALNWRWVQRHCKRTDKTEAV